MAVMAWELRDVAPGLWLWRLEYPDWRQDAGWEPLVTSTCVATGGEVAVLDPTGAAGGGDGDLGTAGR